MSPDFDFKSDAGLVPTTLGEMINRNRVMFHDYRYGESLETLASIYTGKVCI